MRPVLALALLLAPASAGVAEDFLRAFERKDRERQVLIAAQPAGVNVYLFAQRYGTAQAIASTSIFLSTAFSIFSLSAILYLFDVG